MNGRNFLLGTALALFGLLSKSSDARAQGIPPDPNTGRDYRITLGEVRSISGVNQTRPIQTPSDDDNAVATGVEPTEYRFQVPGHMAAAGNPKRPKEVWLRRKRPGSNDFEDVGTASLPKNDLVTPITGDAFLARFLRDGFFDWNMTERGTYQVEVKYFDGTNDVLTTEPLPCGSGDVDVLMNGARGNTKTVTQGAEVKLTTDDAGETFSGGVTLSGPGGDTDFTPDADGSVTIDTTGLDAGRYTLRADVEGRCPGVDHANPHPNTLELVVGACTDDAWNLEETGAGKLEDVAGSPTAKELVDVKQGDVIRVVSDDNTPLTYTLKERVDDPTNPGAKVWRGVDPESTGGEIVRRFDDQGAFGYVVKTTDQCGNDVTNTFAFKVGCKDVSTWNTVIDGDNALGNLGSPSSTDTGATLRTEIRPGGQLLLTPNGNVGGKRVEKIRYKLLERGTGDIARDAKGDQIQDVNFKDVQTVVLPDTLIGQEYTLVTETQNVCGEEVENVILLSTNPRTSIDLAVGASLGWSDTDVFYGADSTSFSGTRSGLRAAGELGLEGLVKEGDNISVGLEGEFVHVDAENGDDDLGGTVTGGFVVRGDYKSGDEVVELEEDASITAYGKNVELTSCISDSCRFVVDGESNWINEGEKEDVNGLAIEVKDITNAPTPGVKDTARVVLGDNAGFEAGVHIGGEWTSTDVTQEVATGTNVTTTNSTGALVLGADGFVGTQDDETRIGLEAGVDLEITGITQGVEVGNEEITSRDGTGVNSTAYLRGVAEGPIAGGDRAAVSLGLRRTSEERQALGDDNDYNVAGLSAELGVGYAGPMLPVWIDRAYVTGSIPLGDFQRQSAVTAGVDFLESVVGDFGVNVKYVGSELNNTRDGSDTDAVFLNVTYQPAGDDEDVEDHVRDFRHDIYNR